MKYGDKIDQLLEKEQNGMASPALDTKPPTDIYTDFMVAAYVYISKGAAQNGQLPISEIHSYYMMFENEMCETRHDFVYLMHVMNQPNLENISKQLEKLKNGKRT